jgi:hypothetical protein
MAPKVDKEFAALIPPLSEDEYTQLEKNLLAEGCRDRLVVWGETLIDGHNRLQICDKHKIPYDIATKEFADRNEAMAYIILNQFGRRNLSLGNKSLLALRLEPLIQANAKTNQKQSPGRGKKGVHNCAHLFPAGEKTRDHLAKIAGVSHGTIDRVKHIVGHGTPEQIERIKDGGKGNTVNAVYKEVRKKTAPVPSSPGERDGGKENKPEKSGVVASPADIPAVLSEEEELKQIKGFVAELKNPNLDRTYTAEMFLAEYEAFAERFIRSVGTYFGDPYMETYPLLSAAQKKRMKELNDAMIMAIQKQISMIRSKSYDT